ncbi:hypothetical protein [Alkalihalobacillus pseudalcaliphilus]|uniref:hypothetical protein n=1 Tax=Alkalihalobacillus pseudalcaliphilus TaxID=79884 RepID=UPI00064D8C34|nr:hypothetical protein [Alkalihalobacillus pseudalcaliphilus]KMK77637.1 hypothetical protein AB990_04050 [Alkalihalobacillus pseudalcaliphilus]
MNTIVSLEGILRFSPFVAKGYTLVIGGGVIAVTAAALERYLAGKSATVIAQHIADIIKIALPIVMTATLIWFVLSNPLL